MLVRAGLQRPRWRYEAVRCLIVGAHILACSTDLSGRFQRHGDNFLAVPGFARDDVTQMRIPSLKRAALFFELVGPQIVPNERFSVPAR
jgi:hypothetical protein